MRWSLWLGIFLGATLAAALVFALQPAPEPPTPSAPAAHEAPTTALPSSPRPLATEALRLQPLAPPTATPPGAEGQAPATGIAPPTADAPQAGWAPVEMAADPFLGDQSAELDYAFQLVLGPESTEATARNAENVFRVCLEAHPEHARCKEGLALARRRLRDGAIPRLRTTKRLDGLTRKRVLDGPTRRVVVAPE